MKKRPFWLFLTLCVVSLLSALATGRVLGAHFSELIPALFFEAFLIFLSALIVESSLLAKLENEAQERTTKLGEKLDQSVREVIQNTLSDARYAAEYHVHILPPRRSIVKHPRVTQEIVSDAVADAKWIKVFCTSGSDVFSRQSPIAAALQTKANLLAKNKDAPLCSITVVTSKPGGKYANLRGLVEDADKPNMVSSDISASRDLLARLKKSSGNKMQCKWLTYDFVPQAWFVLTDTVGFVETYHFGLGCLDENDPSSCLGGRVPLLQVGAHGRMYSAFNDYFDLLAGSQNRWKVSQQRLEDARNNYFHVEEQML